jgi:hypothetical protein
MGHQIEARVTENGRATRIGGLNDGFYILTNVMERN